MEDYLTVCASNKFAILMASSSSFRSLDHAIEVATDIFRNKLCDGCRIEALSCRKCFNTYTATATESTKKGLHEWGSKYRRKFGYAFVTNAWGKSSDNILSELKVRYSNMPLVELDIACQEEMKLIELQLTNNYVDLYFDSDSTQEADERNEEMPLGVETMNLNSDEDTYLGNDHPTEVDNSIDPEENLRGVNGNQTKAEEYDRPEKGFDLNKELWWGWEISDPMKREANRFLTEYFTPGKYDTGYF